MLGSPKKMSVSLENKGGVADSLSAIHLSDCTSILVFSFVPWCWWGVVLCRQQARNGCGHDCRRRTSRSEGHKQNRRHNFAKVWSTLMLRINRTGTPFRSRYSTHKRFEEKSSTRLAAWEYCDNHHAMKTSGSLVGSAIMFRCFAKQSLN